MLRWQRSVKFSTRGRRMTFWARHGAAAHGMRGRGFYWLTIFNSKRLESISRRAVPGGMCRTQYRFSSTRTSA